MAKQESIELEGRVTECLPNAMFRVEVRPGHEVLCTLAGQIFKSRISVARGDRVRVEVSPHDLRRGRIVGRQEA